MTTLKVGIARYSEMKARNMAVARGACGRWKATASSVWNAAIEAHHAEGGA